MLTLRRLGIRTATDLLKAFPPDQIDPRSGDPTPDDARHFERLAAADMDITHIRSVVRVLNEDTRLAPVWNWQMRGVSARCPTRRPRSTCEQPHPPPDKSGDLPA